jgi:hypothetical protein
MTRGDEFPKNAGECRQQKDKERWRKTAEHWLQMAQAADADPNAESVR